MKKWVFIDLAIFLLLSIISLVFSPDAFSLIVICAMCVMVAIAFVKGIWTVLNLAEGFRIGLKYIDVVKEVTTANKWNTFRQTELIFHNKLLDSLWKDYRDQVEREKKENLICSDFESYLNEDILGLHSWKSVILQIPGTLTALGLIGTFLGLILGISGIAFSSVDAAISSITMLLSGIETAFYTSIMGVIFSMVFNISYKLAWNALLRQMGIFMSEFHKTIFPDEEQQKRQVDRTDMDKILSCLERIPKGSEYMFQPLLPGSDKESSERMLMSEIWEGIKQGEFLFYIQPRCDLTTKKVNGGEALMRWNHSRLGIVSPAIFLPILEKNGYIVKLDCQMWESVIITIREWLDAGIRPVPISVNISKMDLLVMDVADFFVNLIQTHQVPPQYLQMEIAENAYIQSPEITKATEARLRQAGFGVIINGAKGEYNTLSLLSDTKADAIKIEYGAIEGKDKNEAFSLTELMEQTRKMRIKLIASGIENVRQLTVLKKAGFVEGQGFFLYKPVDADNFTDLLTESE